MVNEIIAFKRKSWLVAAARLLVPPFPFSHFSDSRREKYDQYTTQRAIGTPSPKSSVGMRGSAPEL